jgi:ankyrin repeat protein
MGASSSRTCGLFGGEMHDNYLMNGVMSGDHDAVRLLLTDEATDVNKVHSMDKTFQFASVTPLMVACARGDQDMVTVLLQKAQVDQQNFEGVTAVAAAATSQHTDIMQVLQSAGASVPLSSTPVDHPPIANSRFICATIMGGTRLPSAVLTEMLPKW